MIVLNRVKDRISDNEYRLLIMFIIVLFIYGYGKIIRFRIMKKENIRMEIVTIKKLIEDNHKKVIHLEDLKFELLDLEKILNDKELEYSLIRNQNDLIEYIESIIGPSFILETISADHMEKNLNGVDIEVMEINIGFKSNYEALLNLIGDSDLNNNKIVLNDMNCTKEEGLIAATMNMNILLDGNSEKILYREARNINLIQREDPFELIEEEDFVELQVDLESEFNYLQNIEKSFQEIIDDMGLEKTETEFKKIEPKNDVKKYNLELSKVITSHDNIWINHRKYVDNKNNITRLEYDFLSKEDVNIIHCEFEDPIKIENKIKGGYLIVDTYASMPIEINILYKDNRGKLLNSSLDMSNIVLGKNKIPIKDSLEDVQYIIGLDLVAAYGVDTSNVLLIDGLEIDYANLSNDYIFHKVDGNQSLKDIVLNYYGDLSMMEEIKKINALKDNDIRDLKIIIIKK